MINILKLHSLSRQGWEGIALIHATMEQDKWLSLTDLLTKLAPLSTSRHFSVVIGCL